MGCQCCRMLALGCGGNVCEWVYGTSVWGGQGKLSGERGGGGLKTSGLWCSLLSYKSPRNKKTFNKHLIIHGPRMHDTPQISVILCLFQLSIWH